MDTHRPLFKHIRNHDTLFSELAMARNSYAQSLGLNDHAYHKTPKFITADGQRLTIEPERSLIVTNYKTFVGVKNILQRQIPGFYIVNNSDIGFRYPTAAIAGLDAPFIKRFPLNFFIKMMKIEVFAGLAIYLMGSKAVVKVITDRNMKFGYQTKI